MTVRIRLALGPRIATKQGHCPRRRAARQMSHWFTQAAAFGYVMTVWKYGYDLGRVKEFAFSQSTMSQWQGLAHWQTWGLLSLIAHACGLPLRRFSETPKPAAPRRAKQPLFVVPPRTPGSQRLPVRRAS